MNDAVDISILPLLSFLILLTLPILTFRYLKLKLTKSLIIATSRMIIQLALVAVYLEYIFKLNSTLVNSTWILIMILAANTTILKQSGLPLKRFLAYTFFPSAITVFFIFLSFLLIFKHQTLFSARYMVPLAGMLLGNILTSSVVGLERFYSEIKKRENEYIQYVSLGASLQEAVKPFLREAYRAAMAPQIAGLATMGLVALPGMMTGQILGGSSPTVAIKYQIMIMIAIFVAASTSVVLSISFSKKAAFDELGRLQI